MLLIKIFVRVLFKRKAYIGILHTFGNNNSNRRICCSSIGIGNGNIIMFWFGKLRYLLREFYIILETIILTIVCVSGVLGLRLATGILYRFIGILKDICNVNIIWFFNL